MKRYKPLYEAKDISNIDPFSSKLIEIQNKDELVKCWHGTNTFWTLWFCTKGISGDIDPPTKTLGRGNMNTGFSKIKTHGLFVSANQTFGFLQYILF